MGLGKWLNKVFGGQEPAPETVAFLDVDAERVIRIPASELPPHAIQVQLQESQELVWALPEKIQMGELKHPPFDEDVRDLLRKIKKAFDEHQPMSLEQWEDGFRRDTHPEREIAIWLHAADIYTAFTAEETNAERRADVYRCVVACMTTGPDTVWQLLRPATLSRAEAEKVVNKFFSKQDG